MPLYQPDTLPYTEAIKKNPDILMRWLRQESQKLAAAIAVLESGFLEIRYTLPLKAQPGMIGYFAIGAIPSTEIDGNGTTPPSVSPEGVYRFTLAYKWRYMG